MQFLQKHYSNITRFVLFGLLMLITFSSVMAQKPDLPTIPVTCDYPTAPATITLTAGTDPVGFSKTYLLVDMVSGAITARNTSSPTFTGIGQGIYYAVTAYYTSGASIHNDVVGKLISDVYVDGLTGGCLKYSATVGIKVCTTTCDYTVTPATIAFTSTPSPTPGVTTTYALVNDATNKILQTSTSASFSSVPVGEFSIVGVYSTGTFILAIGDTLYAKTTNDVNCVGVSNTLHYKVCSVICLAGTVAPDITPTTVVNTCPATTFSLASLTNAGIKPAGTSLIWSTHKVPTSAADTLTNLTTVSTAGKYYALYYDKVNSCYSPADSVTATIFICYSSDTDGDGIANADDLDDDNDGILDTVEDGNCEKVINGTGANGFTGWTQTGNVFSNTSPQFVFNYGESAPNGVMSQVITTVPNQSLQLKFDAVGWGGNTSGNVSVQVDILTGSTVIATKTITKTYGVPWTNETLNFVPTTNQTTIRFTDISTVTTQFDFVVTNISIPGACDLDGDGLVNSFDLDSDGDGCPDAIEGGANLAASTLVTSTMAGGNSGSGYTGTSTSPVTQNLGNTVGSTGIPTIATTGQTVGNSQNKAVQSTNCVAPCVAGTTAPTISQTTVTNVCPATSFSLAGLTNTGTKPAGTSLVWSTHKVPTSTGDTLTNLTTVSTAGKYYALYYDKVGSCYSPADSVTATITICTLSPSAQTATVGQAKTGTASTELSPTGGTGPYTYSVDNSSACTPVSGATALPLSSNFTVTNASTGAYTYTAPLTAGTYYYCTKICDSSTPTANCTTKTYTLSVSNLSCLVGTAIPGLK